MFVYTESMGFMNQLLAAKGIQPEANTPYQKVSINTIVT